MDSKRLFIFIALWLFLSCVLLDHAEGFLIPRKKRRQQRKKRGPNNHLSRRKREMAAFIASHIWTETEVQTPRNRSDTLLNHKFKLHSTASPNR
ncbi:hypothetical protein ABFA07_016518 [Porites harrisoni]